MKNTSRLSKKGLVLVIILLLIGVNVIAGINNSIEKLDTFTNDNQIDTTTFENHDSPLTPNETTKTSNEKQIPTQTPDSNTQASAEYGSSGKKEKPDTPAPLVVATLSNNLLNLEFTERNSQLWEFQWTPGQWGESCYHEHFGVYTGNAATTYESEDFTVDVPFVNPGGGPGTISATLHYNTVQVKRKITLSGGNIKFFEIEYKIKNIGSSTLNDVRFFETIDFDIPWTGDHTDDYAWYDSANDYVVVNDNDYFQNSFTANIPSDRHGIDYWHTEIYEDWDDGNLNNQNSYGPGDPAIGMQYNLGALSTGTEKTIILTVWFGEPTQTEEPYFVDGMIEGDSNPSRDASSTPIKARGANMLIGATKYNFDFDEHKVVFKLTKPDGTIKTMVAVKGSGSGSGWYAQIISFGDFLPKWFYIHFPSLFPFYLYRLHIPGNAAIGEYTITGEIRKKSDDSVVYDIKNFGDFYVIFNPWSSEDTDVYSSSFTDNERELFTHGKTAKQWYPGGSRTYQLNPDDQLVIDTAIQAASGKTTAQAAASKIIDHVTYNAGHDGKKAWKLHHSNNGGYTLGHDYSTGDLPSLTYASDELIVGLWSSTAPGHPSISNYLNIPSILQKCESSSKAPTGQCYNFAALGTALSRAIGIPSRCISTLGGKMAHKPTYCWNFHVWSENYINGAWKPIGTTYQVNPVSRGHALYQTEIEDYSPDGYVEYVYSEKVDGDTLKRVNLINQYKNAQNTLPLKRSDNQTITVHTDKDYYQLDENISIDITIYNNDTKALSDNLSILILGQYGGLEQRFIYNDSIPIDIPPGSHVTETIILGEEEYQNNGYFSIYANTTLAYNFSTVFYVTGGLALNLSIPDSVEKNEAFGITVDIENTQNETIDEVNLSILLSPDLTAVNGTTDFFIPNISPGEINTTSLSLYATEEGYQSIDLIVVSKNGNYITLNNGTYVLKDPHLDLLVDAPVLMSNNSIFAVNVTINNTGDLQAENITCYLNFSEHLSSNDSLIRTIDTLNSNENNTVTWNITAIQKGSGVIIIEANTTNQSVSSTHFVDIYTYDHDINLTLNQSEIGATGQLQEVNMTLYNIGNMNDSVLFEYIVDNDNISFGIYDGDEHIISQSVTVPANDYKILTLKITPEFSETGTITIHAVSEFDPTAAAFVILNITFHDVGVKAIVEPSTPESLHNHLTYGTETHEERGDTFYALNLHDSNNLVWFDSEIPGTFHVIAGSTATDFLAGGCFVINTWYGCEYSTTTSNIWTINEITGSMTLIGPSAVPLNGLAYDPTTNTLYGCSGTNLYTIDQNTGIATLVGPMGNTGTLMIGISCDNNGNMYGEDIGDDNLYTINTTTGSATLIGPLGIDLNYAQDMAYDKDNDKCYITGYKGSAAGGGALYTVNTITGSATKIGDFPIGDMGCPSEVACFAIPYTGNSPPDTPTTPSGPTMGIIGTLYNYSTSTTDPEGDQIYYTFDWGDGNTSGWLGPYNSSETVVGSHSWTHKGEYQIKVKAKDDNGSSESDWSNILILTIFEGAFSPGIFPVEAIVSNYGTHNESFNTNAKIYRVINAIDDQLVYEDNCSIPNLSIDANKTITFTNATINNIGIYRLEITTQLLVDHNPANNQKTMMFLIIDTLPPIITSVVATPTPQAAGGYVNITCTVTDNVNVNTVKVNITSPDGTCNDYLMNSDGYYYNQSYLDQGIYTYFIWANDTSNNVNTSATYTFEITNEPPNIPSNPNPEHGAINVETTIDLTWTGGDPDPNDIVSYDVYFGTQSPPPQIVYNQSATLYDPGQLNFNTKYYWQIVSWDFNNASSPGQIWNFTTCQNHPPNLPSNPNPDNGDTDVDIDTDLSWTGGDPDGHDVVYDIYFGNSTPPPKIADDYTTTSYPLDTLDYETVYYWQIIAEDEYGLITEGPIWHFTTEEPPQLIPDLHAFGTLAWIQVPAGSTQTGTITVKNVGHAGSLLDWHITQWPSWGYGSSFTFDPMNGTDLTPEDGEITVDVVVVAPDKQNQGFSGVVTLVNSNDLTDMIEIPVSLSTPLMHPDSTQQLIFLKRMLR